MLALNSVRGQATTAAIELLLASRRSSMSALATVASQVMRDVVARDQSRSTRAAIGLRLPWLLQADVDNQSEWLELLFGDEVPEVAKSATWDAYLVYSQFFREVVRLLASHYGASVLSLQPRPEDERGRPRDEDEQLGIHVATAHLLAIPVATEGQWLVEFYARAADWLRARVTRWIGEQAASAEVGTDIRARARQFLEDRVSVAEADGDSAELKAVSWIASGTDHEGEALEAIILPALEKTGGATENGVGAVSLAGRQSADCPRAVQLLVNGDPWRSLPDIASAELRGTLEALMRSQDDESRRMAEDAINTLGAQGYLEFRDLLSVRNGRGDEPRPVRDGTNRC